MSTFKLDYSNITSDENLNKLRQSKYMGMKNLTVSNDFSAGKVKFSNGHITTSDTKDPVIYFDDQVNILQSAYTDDADVINTDKNTSFIDYRNLSKTYYTKIGGANGEDIFKNNKTVDKDNNLYVAFESGSFAVNIFDSTNNDIPVSDLITSQEGDSRDVVIVKYNHLGVYQWATHIGGYFSKNYPSLVCDSDGNVIVCFGNNNTPEDYVKIYDTTDNVEPVNLITNATSDSAIIVKYNTDGVFQWTVQVEGINNNDSPNAKISCDVDGNVFIAQAMEARQLKIYDKTPEEYIPRPDDFFCVIIDHFHTGDIRFSQPILTYTTGFSNYNYATIKFDKEGKLKWVNHVEVDNSIDYSRRCHIDNDVDGNVILTGNFADTMLKVWNPLNISLVVPDATLFTEPDSYGYDNIFIIKFDPNGNVIWCTKAASYDDNSNYVNTITDANSNIYVTLKSEDDVTYLFDTTNATNPVKTLEAKVGNDAIILIKYNEDGVLQWYTLVDGTGSQQEPCVAIDNRFIKGTEHSNIYLSGEFYNKLNFYNSGDELHIAYTLEYDNVNESDNVFLACFNQDGIFSWATRTATVALDNYEGTGNVYDMTITADKDGHVYLLGEYEIEMNIYDAQNNDNPVATLKMTEDSENDGHSDLFIIKYNRYGLLNTSNPKLLYIEDNVDLPDSFCKEVILTNNDNNGIVNLQILHKENYGYSVRRNVLITEAIELITKGGIWIPKIIANQYEYVNDLDVIDPNTKTSFVNYQNLQNSFFTKLGSGGDDLNPQIYLDKYDNVYMAGVYQSDELNIYDFTNNSVPVGALSLDGEQSLFLTKYNQAGINQWYTRIGGYYDKEEPSVFVNGNGDMFITMQCQDDGDVKFYDVNNVTSPVFTLSGTSDNSYTIFVKYNNKGEYQWHIRVVAENTNETASFTSTAVVTGDLNGHLIISGFFDGDFINVYDTSSNNVPFKIFSRDGEAPAAYFICKFDYTGKFLWVNHLEGGFIPNNDGIPVPPDILRLIRINLNTDSSGNIYLTSSFYGAVAIYDPDSTQVISIFGDESSNIGLFSIKYNSSGFHQWYNGILSNSDGEMGPFTGILESGSCVDADGNLYVTFSNNYLYDYEVNDTRTIPQPVYVYENEFEHDNFVSIVKFNSTGVFQWANSIKANEVIESNELVVRPTITCDNNYITGQYNANIYVHLNGFVNDYRSGFNFYNASSPLSVAYTLPSKDYWMEDSTIHSILAKYDINGNFQWATTAAGYTYEEEDLDLLATNIQTDRSGHVYICGSYYENNLLIWDVSRNGVYDDEIGTLENNGNFDCFLIKYNRYGLINGGNTHPDIYLEDVPNIPNAFEKSIVITNNTNNGPVNCQILEPLSSGFGYSFRKTITLTDYLDLVSHNGKWIPKIQSEQISISQEFDVIDPNTKLSVLDYNDLSNSSWVTRIAGDGDERNPKLSYDKHNNMYALFSFTSDPVKVYAFSGGYDSIDRQDSTRNIGLVKYLSNGYTDWRTKISFDSNDFTGYPSLYTDAEGNSYVTLVKTDDETADNIYIYDTRDNNSSFKTVTLSNRGVSLIKYDKDGVYLWDIRVNATFNNGDGSYGTNAVADKNGNVYLSGFINDNDGVKIRDTTDVVQKTFGNNNGMFVVKFDKTGKYIWSVPLYNGITTEDRNIALSCDNDGNVIVSAGQYDTVTVYEKVGNTIRYFTDINKVSVSNGNIFTVKYDTDGKCLWTNRLGTDDNQVVFNPVSAIDSYGNYYLAATIQGLNAHIFDTRDSSNVRYIISLPTNYTYCTIFAKYNKNGIVQWYNYLSGYSSTPSICIDNKFIQGISENSVYLSGYYTGDIETGDISLYNRGQNGGSPNYVTTLTNENYTYLIKFNNDGYIRWCSKVGNSSTDINNSVVATSDGHVYLAGDFNTDFVDVYQGWTLDMDPNSDIATTINNYSESNTYDIFLVKYNRFGTVNSGDYRFGKEVYLENSNSIPDGTEKSIVIIDNGENNGYRENICLMVLQYNYIGYSSFRNIWFSEGVSLISYGGQWFVKSSSGDTLPKRSIIMWGGNQSNIPRGWRLCDGGSLNGVTTPDLRGRFILGYNNDAAGVNGSSTSGGNTTTGTGARTETSLSGTVGLIGGEVLHTVTNSEMPVHNHGGVTGEGGAGTSSVDAAVSLTTNPAIYASGSHNHSISNDGGGSAHNNIPPYYVLAMIMKCF